MTHEKGTTSPRYTKRKTKQFYQKLKIKNHEKA